MIALADSFSRIVRVYREKRGHILGYRDNRSFGGPREMFDAVCSDCGQACKVPFKPIEGRAVYCRDCYQKKKSY